MRSRINFNILPQDRILVVAPHPDDESIGCGGLLSAYGSQCDVWLLTDGRLGMPHTKKTEKEAATLRQQEFENALSFYNVRKAVQFEIRDQEAYQNRKKLRAYSIREYTYIFVPNQADWHPDHCFLYKFFRKMKKRQNAAADIVEYELWSPLERANLFLDISAVMDQKRNAVMQYASQLKNTDYLSLCEGLNQYRGALTHCSYAEAYFSTAQAKKISRYEARLQLWKKIPFCIRRKIKRVAGEWNIFISG